MMIGDEKEVRKMIVSENKEKEVKRMIGDKKEVRKMMVNKKETKKK